MYNKLSMRKSLKSSASFFGLAAFSIGWAGLAQAASEASGPQTLLLPDHYRLIDGGTVVFQLEGGEELSLNPGQYVILQDGLLLITDEFAQASMQSLPVMGSIRAQLTSELQPVRSPDGSVVQASDASPLWSGDGPAPRLFDEIDIQRFEIAQDQQEEDEDDEGVFLGGAGGALVGIGFTTLGIMNTGAADTEDETTDGGGSGGGDSGGDDSGGGGFAPEPEFLSNAMFQALTPATARTYTGSAGDSYIGYSSASTSTPDALIEAGYSAGNSASFDMSAGGNNTFLADTAAAQSGGVLNYTGGDLSDSLTFGVNLAANNGTVTLNVGNGDNTLTAGDNGAIVSGTFVYNGGSGKDDLTVGNAFASSAGDATINAGNGDNTLNAGTGAASVGAYSEGPGKLTYNGGTGSDALTFGLGLAAFGGQVTLDLGSDTAADTVTFLSNFGMGGGNVTIKNFNYNHDTIDVDDVNFAPTGAPSEFTLTNGDQDFTYTKGASIVTFEGIGPNGTGVVATTADLMSAFM